MSNYWRIDVILVGSIENEQSFAENKVLLNNIFKGAFFSGKTRRLIFENTYFYEPVLGPESGV